MLKAKPTVSLTSSKANPGKLKPVATPTYTGEKVQATRSIDPVEVSALDNELMD